jgi:hypothetical protein
VAAWVVGSERVSGYKISNFVQSFVLRTVVQLSAGRCKVFVQINEPRDTTKPRLPQLSVTNSTKGKAWATALETIKNEFSLLRYAHRHLQVQGLSFNVDTLLIHVVLTPILPRC